MFLCGIARNQTEMLDLFERVFLLMVDDETQMARAREPSADGFDGSDQAIKRQIREGRPVFQARMLSKGLSL